MVQRSLSKWRRRWHLARPASSQHQSAKGSPAPSSWFPLLQASCRVGPARQAAHRETAVCGFSASLPRAMPPLPAPGCFWLWENCVLSEAVPSAKHGGVGCQKVVSWNFKTLNLNSIPYTWWVLYWGGGRFIALICSSIVLSLKIRERIAYGECTGFNPWDPVFNASFATEGHGLPVVLTLANSKYSTSRLPGSSEIVRESYAALWKVYISIYVNKAYLAQSSHAFPIVLSCFKESNSFKVEWLYLPIQRNCQS